jgi:hypothetical protein
MKYLLTTLILISGCSSTKKTKSPYDDDASLVIYQLNRNISEVEVNYYGCTTNFTVLTDDLNKELLYKMVFYRSKKRYEKGCKN